MMTNIFAKSIALAGLIAVSSVVGESVRAVTSNEAAPQQQQQQHQRRLDDNLCLMCELCDALSDLCDFGLIQDFACITCEDDDDGGDDDPDSDICFSELATVQVLQHQKEITVQMKDLQVGDQIRTDSTNKYETVYAFGHNNPTRKAQFYQIYNEQSTNPLEITADHMVFVHNNNDDKQTPVAASTLQVGDVLTSSNGPSKVTKISTVERTGIYAPLTTGGTLLVDGVKASSYIAVGQQTKQSSSLLSDHTLVHVTLSPYRMICTGISQQFCKPESYNDDGMPYYVEFGLNLLHWMNSSSNSILKALVFGAVVASTGALFSLELLFGSSLAPLMIFIAAVAYMSQGNSNSNKKNKAKVL